MVSDLAVAWRADGFGEFCLGCVGAVGFGVFFIIIIIFFFLNLIIDIYLISMHIISFGEKERYLMCRYGDSEYP